VKCTRCQHVFRAVPPAPAAPAETAAPRPTPSEDRTEAFGFSKGAPPETTASFASAPPPGPEPHRPSPPPQAAVPPPAAPRPARWPWILVVLGVVAAALVAAWLKTRS
jgi:2-oxoglutarate dehydrogenase E2 component (dihydrolipoamide succinyltransferase)